MSLEHAITEALYTLLAGDEESLRGEDARPVAIWRDDPEHTFSDKALPVVAIDWPRASAVEDWNSSEEHWVFEVAVFCIDSARPSRERFRQAFLRLGGLRERVIASLRASRTLGLAKYQCIEDLWSVERMVSEEEQAGNNLMRIGLGLRIPLIVAKRLAAAPEPVENANLTAPFTLPAAA